ncbi:hypothetical protein GCM10010191_50360 [Actinomadura vinacea]|uniref:Uncharacterized protein n=1 Tax=Actinomadura vinacea TaxID=115336 RepID=A0ABN3JKM1_9ACTN
MTGPEQCGHGYHCLWEHSPVDFVQFPQALCTTRVIDLGGYGFNDIASSWANSTQWSRRRKALVDAPVHQRRRRGPVAPAQAIEPGLLPLLMERLPA